MLKHMSKLTKKEILDISSWLVTELDNECEQLDYENIVSKIELDRLKTKEEKNLKWCHMYYKLAHLFEDKLLMLDRTTCGDCMVPLDHCLCED